MKIILVPFLLCAVGQISGQITVPGLCPSISNSIPIEWDKFSSIWFEQRRFPMVGEVETKCNHFQFTFYNNEDFEVIERRDQSAIFTKGKIKGANELVMFDFDDNIFNHNYQFWVIDTDYFGYAVTFSCYQVNENYNLQNAWILTREIHPHRDTIHQGVRVLQENGVNTDHLLVSDQSGC